MSDYLSKNKRSYTSHENDLLNTSHVALYIQKPTFLNIVARTPLFELMCKDGRSSPAFFVLVEIPSLDNISRRFRLCFVYHVAECLTHFVSPNDTVRIFNVARQLMCDDDDEIVLGRSDAELFWLQDDTHPETVTLILYRQGNQLPGILEVSLKTKQICFQYLPEWTNTLHLPTIVICSSLADRLWSKPLPASLNTSCDVLFTDLVYLQERALVNFFACVVDVSLAPRFLTLPHTGQVAVMNVTVVDPSLAKSYRIGLLCNHTFRLSVMFIASKPDQLPCITCGDIIRVYQGGFYVTQDMKTKATYLNCRTDPTVTHLSVWSINKLASPYNTQQETLLVDDIGPSWSSLTLPLLMENESSSVSLKKMQKSPASYWNKVTQLAQWVAESLYTCNCFINEYSTSLSQIAQGTKKRHCDLFVHMVGSVGESMQRLRDQKSYNRKINSGYHQISHFPSHSPPSSYLFPDETFTRASNRQPPCTISSLCFHVLDGNESTSLPLYNRASLVHLFNLPLPHYLYLNQHVEKGDWLLLKNVLFLQLIPASFDHDPTALDIYEFDASRCRSVKLPLFSKEVQEKCQSC